MKNDDAELIQDSFGHPRHYILRSESTRTELSVGRMFT